MNASTTEQPYSQIFVHPAAQSGGAIADPNPELGDFLKTIELQGRWIEKNAAVLIIHGIGNQRALETLGNFGTNLLGAIRDSTGMDITAEHRVQCEPDVSTGGTWFNNYVRLTPASSDAPYLDVYEYYWAYQTEDEAKFKDIRAWLRGVVRGAKTHYAEKENEVLSKNFERHSFFFNNGRFHPFRYKFFLYVIGYALPMLDWLISGLLGLIGKIPFLGGPAETLANSISEGLFHGLDNLLGDITIYNTADEKSKFNVIRRKILNGAVSALQQLIEPEGPESEQTYTKWRYDQVLVAGHSLGSQIGYDAINRINFLIQEGQVKGIRTDGSLKTDVGSNSISQKLVGFVTFGSPLDKIAFFLSDRIPDDERLRRAILADFYGFRQRESASSIRIFEQTSAPTLHSEFIRLFEDVPWRNYYDKHDYVSGSLDFYKNVTNVRCQFDGFFTHANYWQCREMHAEIFGMLLSATTTPASGAGNKLTVDAPLQAA